MLTHRHLWEMKIVLLEKVTVTFFVFSINTWFTLRRTSHTSSTSNSSYTQRTFFFGNIDRIFSTIEKAIILVDEGLVFLYAGAKIIGRFWNVIGTMACWRSTSNAVVSLTNEMNAKCLEEKKFKKKRFFFNKPTYFLWQWFSHHVQDRMFESNSQFLHQLSERREMNEWNRVCSFTSRGKFFINKRLAINWLCRGIFASFNLFIKFKCSWLGILLPVEWLISIRIERY